MTGFIFSVLFQKERFNANRTSWNTYIEMFVLHDGLWRHITCERLELLEKSRALSNALGFVHVSKHFGLVDVRNYYISIATTRTPFFITVSYSRIAFVCAKLDFTFLSKYLHKYLQRRDDCISAFNGTNLRDGIVFSVRDGKNS